jgi:hypothetical protein
VRAIFSVYVAFIVAMFAVYLVIALIGQALVGHADFNHAQAATTATPSRCGAT